MQPVGWKTGCSLLAYPVKNKYHLFKPENSKILSCLKFFRNQSSSSGNNPERPKNAESSKPNAPGLKESGGESKHSGWRIPKLRLKPRERNLAPLAVAIVAIPFAGIGIRAYWDQATDFYEELQKLIPLLPNRTKEANVNGTLDSPPAKSENPNMSTDTNYLYSKSEAEESQDTNQSVSDPKNDATSPVETAKPVTPSVNDHSDHTSDVIVRNLTAFSEVLKEEISQKLHSTGKLVENETLDNQSYAAKNSAVVEESSNDSPMKRILERISNENLTADELKEQVRNILSELEDRNRWEAFRIQEAVNAQALQDQKEFMNKKSELENYYSRMLAEQLRQIREEMEQRLEEQLKTGYDTITEQVKAQTEEELQVRSVRLEEEYNQHKKALEEEMEANLKNLLEEERKSRLRMLENLQVQVRALKTQFSENSNFQKLCAYAHRISSLAYALDGLVSRNEPFQAQLVEMKAFVDRMSESEPNRTDSVSDVQMMKQVISTISNEAAQKGVPSEVELIGRFQQVLKHLRYVALIPDEKASSMWSHLVAYVISMLKIPEKGLVSGDSPESRIARAEYFVEKHDILHAVRELEGLNGLCGELVADWLQLARWRVTLQQAVKASRAVVVLEEEALS
eukprot:jgi/Galph1/1117/GphlegSOOS_G5842.1